MLHVNCAWEPHVNQDSHTECCMFTLHGSHMLIQIPSHFTHSFSKKIIKIPLENLCMWVATLQTIKSITNEFISGVKRAKKEIATCGKFVALSSCCEQPAAGMLWTLPVHFVPLQWNRKLCNMHDSHVAPENVCMIKLYGTLVACHLKSVKNVWNVHVATNSSLLQSPQNPQKCVKRVW